MQWRMYRFTTATTSRERKRKRVTRKKKTQEKKRRRRTKASERFLSKDLLFFHSFSSVNQSLPLRLCSLSLSSYIWRTCAIYSWILFCIHPRLLSTLMSEWHFKVFNSCIVKYWSRTRFTDFSFDSRWKQSLCMMSFPLTRESLFAQRKKSLMLSCVRKRGWF